MLTRISTVGAVAGIRAALAMRSYCSSADEGPVVAPRREKKGMKKTVLPDAAAMPKSNADIEAELGSTAFAKKLENLATMNPEQLEAIKKDYEAREEREQRILSDDSLYQMEVSMKLRHQGGHRVFWKGADIMEITEGGKVPHYAITVDGRKVKAFESENYLVVPTKDFALAVAKEWHDQKGMVNKLLMPLTDLASGGQHVAPQAISSRIDYLMAFFMNDNLYYRARGSTSDNQGDLAAVQDEMIEPIREWYKRAYGVDAPRILGIGHPNIDHGTVQSMKRALHEMNMNAYQVVAMCVVAQFSASLMLPLAVFNNIISVEQALIINRLEEFHNINTHGEIEGYHDIREADVRVKIAASVVGWQLTNGIAPEDAIPPLEMLRSIK